ncbi:hypothetical protein D081_1677 [Anaerovibrio sp. JC8]|nr:hypothetical protein D081_1677 [Anaerovibrio sp. JC8]
MLEKIVEIEQNCYVIYPIRKINGAENYTRGRSMLKERQNGRKNINRAIIFKC